MIEKAIAIDRIEVLESGHIQVRRVTRIMEDKKEIGKSYHRWTLSPGDTLEGQDEKIVKIAGVAWTDEVLAMHRFFVDNRRD